MIMKVADTLRLCNWPARLYWDFDYNDVTVMTSADWIRNECECLVMSARRHISRFHRDTPNISDLQLVPGDEKPASAW